MQVGSAIARRHSTRRYTGDPMPLRALSTILWAAAGRSVRPGEASEPAVFRTTASAGALYPVSFVVAALRVDGLPAAVYAYEPARHGLREIADRHALPAVLAALASPDELIMVSRACLLGLLTARPWRSMRKYGARGMRHVFLEAGAVAAHTHLACAALGYGGVDCSSVFDDEIHQALGMDGVHEALVHTMVIGGSDG